VGAYGVMCSRRRASAGVRLALRWLHVAQAARVMAKQYGTEVGPWVPFLPVLTDHPVPRS